MRNLVFSSLLGAALTLLFLYPIVRTIDSHLTSREDGVFIAWTINRVSHQLQAGAATAEAPIFHPFVHTGAYSDPFLINGLTNIPVTWFTSNVILMHNLQLLSGTVIIFVAMWLLAGRLYYSPWSAAFSALIFTFAAMHLHYLVHLQVYLIAGLPLTIYFLLTWVDTQRSQYLTLTVFAFLLQTLNSPMTGYFLLAIGLCLWLTHTKLRITIWNHRLLVGLYGVLTLTCLATVYWPYLQVSQAFNYTRSIRDTAHFAHSLEKFFEPEMVLLYVLSGFGWLAWKRRAQPFSQWPWFPLLVLGVGGVLMLGPALKYQAQTVKIFNLPIPLPYAVLYYLVPGFKAFRATSRWITVFNFGLSLLVGWSVSQVTIEVGHRTRLLVAGSFLLLTAFFWFENQQNLKLYPVPLEIPAIYQIVKERPETVLAEFPVFSWRMHPYNYLENDRLLGQANHGKTLYNGVSGFTPPIRERQWDWLWREFPSGETIDHLKKEGVELVIVHYDIYQEMTVQNYRYQDIPVMPPDQLKAALETLPLQLIGCEQSKCLYRFL